MLLCLNHMIDLVDFSKKQTNLTEFAASADKVSKHVPVIEKNPCVLFCFKKIEQRLKFFLCFKNKNSETKHRNGSFTVIRAVFWRNPLSQIHLNFTQNPLVLVSHRIVSSRASSFLDLSSHLVVLQIDPKDAEKQTWLKMKRQLQELRNPKT